MWGDTGVASQRMDVEAGQTVDWRGGGLEWGCPRIWLSGWKASTARCLSARSAKHFARGAEREEG